MEPGIRKQTLDSVVADPPIPPAATTFGNSLLGNGFGKYRKKPAIPEYGIMTYLDN